MNNKAKNKNCRDIKYYVVTIIKGVIKSNEFLTGGLGDTKILSPFNYLLSSPSFSSCYMRSVL